MIVYSFFFIRVKDRILFLLVSTTLNERRIRILSEVEGCILSKVEGGTDLASTIM